MKVIIVGLGSIGQRHKANLLALRASAEIVTVDPVNRDANHPGLRAALDKHPDAQAAIIASPTRHHLNHMRHLANANIPFLVEKPMLDPAGIKAPEIGAPPTDFIDRGQRCAVNFQYRAHPDVRRSMSAWQRAGAVHWFGQDNLLDRYGWDVDGIMVAHPIDTSCWLFGKPLSVHLISDGARLGGWIEHERGRSSYHFDMSRGPRTSWAECDGHAQPLAPDDGMYVALMRAWLDTLDGWDRPDWLPTLADGLRVSEVLGQVQHA